MSRIPNIREAITQRAKIADRAMYRKIRVQKAGGGLIGHIALSRAKGRSTFRTLSFDRQVQALVDRRPHRRDFMRVISSLNRASRRRDSHGRFA